MSTAAQKLKTNKACYDRRPPEWRLWVSAYTRARKKKIEFTITPEDIVIPSVCPALGTPFVSNRGISCGPNRSAASLDRIRPDLGYVPGNIIVISVRANSIKNDATADEVKKVAAWLSTLQGATNAIPN